MDKPNKLDEAIEAQLSRFKVRIRPQVLVVDNSPAPPLSSGPSTLIDCEINLLRAITDCEDAFARLRRAMTKC